MFLKHNSHKLPTLPHTDRDIRRHYQCFALKEGTQAEQCLHFTSGSCIIKFSFLLSTVPAAPVQEWREQWMLWVRLLYTLTMIYFIIWPDCADAFIVKCHYSRGHFLKFSTSKVCIAKSVNCSFFSPAGVCLSPAGVCQLFLQTNLFHIAYIIYKYHTFACLHVHCIYFIDLLCLSI